MKQKVVISVSTSNQKRSLFCGCFGTPISPNENKFRCKALQVVVGVPGVESVALKGDEKDSIVVIGDGIDAVVLITLLRKHMGNARLVSVGPAAAAADDQTTGTATEKVKPIVWPACQPCHLFFEVPSHEPSCFIW